MNVNSLVKKTFQLLSEEGWREVKDYPEQFELVVTREETKVVVTTKRIIAFLRGDNISRDEIQEAVEEAHKMMGGKANAPLFPATSVVVFVFEKENEFDWILKKGKKRDVGKSNFTVSWIVDLSKKILKEHKGLPIINSGKAEIREVLSFI